jgi:hypothetical protein
MEGLNNKEDKEDKEEKVQKTELTSHSTHGGYGASFDFSVEGKNAVHFWKNDAFILSKTASIDEVEFNRLKGKYNEIFKKFKIIENNGGTTKFSASLIQEEIDVIKKLSENTRSFQEAI